MKLVISMRRAYRETAPGDWMEQVLHIEGVTADSAPLFGRLTVTATPEGHDRLVRALGDRCIIEPVIRHDTQSPGD